MVDLMAPGAPAAPLHAADEPLLDEYRLATHGRLVSYSAPISSIEPRSFLRQAAGRERFLWQARNGIVLAGVGVATNLTAWGETRFAALERQADELFAHAVVLNSDDPLTIPRLFGGFAFRSDFIADQAWSGFQPAHFVLPHYQLARQVTEQGERTWLTINTLLDADEEPQSVEVELAEALHAYVERLQGNTTSAPAVRYRPDDALADVTNGTPSVRYPLSYGQWANMIEAALDAFQQSKLRKVVLSRICEVDFEAPIPIDDALDRLAERYPDCYLFLFEPRSGHAFLGATPELLVGVQGDEIATMGLAGSAPRGDTPQQDRALGDALLASPKNRHEHALVVDAMHARLKPLMDELEIPESPAVLTLSNIQHLFTPIHGRLHQSQGVLPLVDLLHPTPALGGFPREQALRFLHEREQTERGWYAAPVGWIDCQRNGAFAVAIRSAVVQDERAWLYAGAGVVADSRPAAEWVETSWKLRPMLQALGVDWRAAHAANMAELPVNEAAVAESATSSVRSEGELA